MTKAEKRLMEDAIELLKRFCLLHHSGNYDHTSEPWILNIKLAQWVVDKAKGAIMTTLHITLEQAVSQPAKLSDHLNYASYASHRDRLDWPAAKVQAMFVRLGIGSELEVEDWEQRYQAIGEKLWPVTRGDGRVVMVSVPADDQDCEEGAHAQLFNAARLRLCVSWLTGGAT